MQNEKTILLSFLVFSAGLGCESAPAEPVSQTQEKPQAIVDEPAIPPMKVAKVPISPDDPLKGKFTLEDATKGLDGSGKLTATLETSNGTLSCELYEDKAPITVANFVGLARGLRPFKLDGEWVTRPGYDGTTFHRVIKGFMIQGGDPKGTGAGEPGYVIPDEVWHGAKHDERGQLCMANRGPNTNGMQFFIMDGRAPHLDKGYTIFGKCGPESVIEVLANTKTRGDRALEAPKINKVTVTRK
jgi:peptidyl-prolyl cis-trans isomerase A (cyclophilin A)